jgi:hypothetical protein
MGKISPRLQEQLQHAALGATQRCHLIVDLAQDADWTEGLRLVKEAGLEVSAQEQAIGAVFGAALPQAIARIAAIPAVRLVELDEQATTLK